MVYVDGVQTKNLMPCSPGVEGRIETTLMELVRQLKEHAAMERFLRLNRRVAAHRQKQLKEYATRKER